MSADSLVFWLFVGAWLVVLGLIMFVQLPRALREARRIVKRVLGLADQSPLSLQIAKAGSDVNRMRLAVGNLASLQRRAVAAVAVIRTTPIVPPAITHTIERIRIEIRAFRRAAR